MKLLNKHLSIALALIVSPSLIYAQKSNSEIKSRKGKNEIHLSFTPQYYLNKLSVHNDGVIPNPISTKNMPGFNLSMDYNRVTRYGLVYGAGISFGQIGHDVTIHFKDLSFFYPDDDHPYLKEELAKESTYYHHRENLNFLSIHPTIGYRFKMPERFMKGWNLQINLTYVFLRYLNGSNHLLSLKMDFPNKAGDTMFVGAPFLSYYTQFGKTPWMSFWGEEFHGMYEADITFSKEMNCHWISNINIGFKVTYAGEGRNSPDGSYYHSQTSGSGFAYAKSYTDKSVYEINPQPASNNEYRARDFSIGIKLGVGLWPVKKAK